jgi:hypothetical protein
MSIKTEIIDGKGKGKSVEVTKDGALLVATTGVPPSTDSSSLKPFASYMVDDTGDEDMRVDGSTNNVDYSINSSSEGDRYVHTMAITIADAGASLNKFGNITALTNGCQLIWEDSKLGEVIIADALKTNFDFIQLGAFEPSFGTGNDAFKLANVVSTSEAYVAVLDIEDVFGLPFGLLLPQDSTRKLIIRIRDNTSTVDRFDVKVFGYDKIGG